MSELDAGRAKAFFAMAERGRINGHKNSGSEKARVYFQDFLAKHGVQGFVDALDAFDKPKPKRAKKVEEAEEA